MFPVNPRLTPTTHKHPFHYSANNSETGERFRDYVLANNRQEALRLCEYMGLTEVVILSS